MQPESMADVTSVLGVVAQEHQHIDLRTVSKARRPPCLLDAVVAGGLPVGEGGPVVEDGPAVGQGGIGGGAACGLVGDVALAADGSIECSCVDGDSEEGKGGEGCEAHVRKNGVKVMGELRISVGCWYSFKLLIQLICCRWAVSPKMLSPHWRHSELCKAPFCDRQPRFTVLQPTDEEVVVRL
jgi:hypothetical protein